MESGLAVEILVWESVVAEESVSMIVSTVAVDAGVEDAVKAVEVGCDAGRLAVLVLCMDGAFVLLGVIR